MLRNYHSFASVFANLVTVPRVIDQIRYLRYVDKKKKGKRNAWPQAFKLFCMKLWQGSISIFLNIILPNFEVWCFGFFSPFSPCAPTPPRFEKSSLKISFFENMASVSTCFLHPSSFTSSH